MANKNLRAFYEGRNRPVGMNAALLERIHVTIHNNKVFAKMQEISEKTEQVILSSRLPEQQESARTYKALAEASLARLAKN